MHRYRYNLGYTYVHIHKLYSACAINEFIIVAAFSSYTNLVEHNISVNVYFYVECQ